MDASDTEERFGEPALEGSAPNLNGTSSRAAGAGGTGAPDFENAAHFATQVSHWLDLQKRQSERVTEQDWHRVLRQVADALTQFEALEFVQKDAHAQALYARLARSADLEDFNEQLDRFLTYLAGVYSEQILAQSGGHISAQTGRSSRRPLETSAEQQIDMGDARRSRARTRMRL